jgi:hypothetical protein
MSLGWTQTASGTLTSTMVRVLYEVVIDLCKDKILWTANPKPAIMHDITFSCGGTQVSTNCHKNEATWDANALYFQIP